LKDQEVIITSRKAFYIKHSIFIPVPFALSTAVLLFTKVIVVFLRLYIKSNKYAFSQIL